MPRSLPHAPPLLGWFLPAYLCTCLGSACGPAARPESVTSVELPSYTPTESVLFDDQFDEAVYRQVPWEPNSKLGDRVKLADSVVVARIVTVSEQAAAAGPPPLGIELQPYGRALAGVEPEGNVRLTLAPDSPSYRLFRWQLPLVLGKDVVLFYRRYEQDGEAQVHFRGEPNIDAVHRAIQQVQLNR